ncbi:transposase domain-containing protein [Pseudomonas sp. Q1]
MSGNNPYAYFDDVLTRLPIQHASKIDPLLRIGICLGDIGR